MSAVAVAASQCRYWIEQPVYTGESQPIGGNVPITWYIVKSGTEQLRTSAPSLPNIGTEIEITLNKIGPAKVEGYMQEYGMVGIIARPSNPPEWWIKQNRENHIKNKYNPLDGVVGLYTREWKLK